MTTMVDQFIKGIELPDLYAVRQYFDDRAIVDVEQSVHQCLTDGHLPDLTRKRVGIGIGSRGIADISSVARATVDWVKRRGGNPFIVPAMGSHGGGSAAGQEGVLASLGVTVKTVDAPIRGSVEVREVGRAYGQPVYFSNEALSADLLILINRIKPHTAFHGPRESGLTKMLAIGLGKQKGAETIHGLGLGLSAETIPQFAEVIMRAAPPVYGLALVENAYHRIAQMRVLAGDQFALEEPPLLIKAKELMPTFPMSEFDVLVVDQIGKNISGDGMDPNITGRYATPYASGGAEINKVVVLGLTEETHGNGNGIGMADLTTEHVLSSIDWDVTYVNALTATVTTTIKRPLALSSDDEAVRLAIKLAASNPAEAKLIRVRDTLSLERVLVSQTVLDAVTGDKHIEIEGGPYRWADAPWRSCWN